MLKEQLPLCFVIYFNSAKQKSYYCISIGFALRTKIHFYSLNSGHLRKHTTAGDTETRSQPSAEVQLFKALPGTGFMIIS